MYQDDATGQLGVLVVSSGDQAVWHRRQTGREPDKWSDWESLGQPDGDPVQGPVATATLSDGPVMAGSRAPQRNQRKCMVQNFA